MEKRASPTTSPKPGWGCLTGFDHPSELICGPGRFISKVISNLYFYSLMDGSVVDDPTEHRYTKHLFKADSLGTQLHAITRIPFRPTSLVFDRNTGLLTIR